ncbi:hypothetical protein VVYB158_11935 [Vibrio vulnificus CladeA-yb158]|uniref:hypothetical protein n=1 Tax=Vibrio TaxID=662 RepID=UPI00063DD036|nr:MULTISPECIES: hypothetical protein [Vibrio]KLI67626.1 hypothetical protein VVYB158_11935 [Vibrio vulnificus CladeA-yb158]MBT0085074.1 hypothetical protein [Vibrio alginolyticus]MCF7372218.1 hypothetical protein [Vibrio sp. J2-3(2022)]
MKKSENTLLQLEAALQRILIGKTKRIPEHRKLSVRAVEEEAGLGNGSCYYYKEFKLKVQSEAARIKASLSITPVESDLVKLRLKRNEERRIKIQYREQVDELKAMVAQMAAEHHQLSHALRKAHLKITQLEHELIEQQRKQIVRIK